MKSIFYILIFLFSTVVTAMEFDLIRDESLCEDSEYHEDKYVFTLNDKIELIMYYINNHSGDDYEQLDLGKTGDIIKGFINEDVAELLWANFKLASEILPGNFWGRDEDELRFALKNVQCAYLKHLKVNQNIPHEGFLKACNFIHDNFDALKVEIAGFVSTNFSQFTKKRKFETIENDDNKSVKRRKNQNGLPTATAVTPEVAKVKKQAKKSGPVKISTQRKLDRQAELADLILKAYGKKKTFLFSDLAAHYKIGDRTLREDLNDLVKNELIEQKHREAVIQLQTHKKDREQLLKDIRSKTVSLKAILKKHQFSQPAVFYNYVSQELKLDNEEYAHLHQKSGAKLAPGEMEEIVFQYVSQACEEELDYDTWTDLYKQCPDKDIETLGVSAFTYHIRKILEDDISKALRKFLTRLPLS